MRTARRGATLALVAGTGCATEPPAVLRVGDAVPRVNRGASVAAVVAAMFDTSRSPRLELVPWSVPSGQELITESEQAQRFAADSSIVAVVGHAGSKFTLIASPTYRAAGIPLLVPTATARALRNAGPHLFMLAPSDDAIGAFLVDRALDSLRLQRIAIMYVADPYGEGIRAGVVEHAGARGTTLVGESALTGLECQRTALAARAITRAFMLRTRPDGIILALPQDLAFCVIREAVAIDSTITILASDSFSPAAVDGELQAAEARAVHRVVLWEVGTDSLNREFEARFRRLVGRPPDAGQALTADAFLLVEAAVRAGHRTREGVHEWLRQLGTPGHPPFAGITGPIDFTRPRVTGLRLRRLASGTGAP